MLQSTHAADGSVLHSIQEHHGNAHLPQSHWVEFLNVVSAEWPG